MGGVEASPTSLALGAVWKMTKREIPREFQDVGEGRAALLNCWIRMTWGKGTEQSGFHRGGAWGGRKPVAPTHVPGEEREVIPSDSQPKAANGADFR